MPIIHIHLLAGRSAKMKAQLLRDVTAAAAGALDVSAATVRILLHEIAPEHWAAGGISKAPPTIEGET